jgi:hypothetical protein
MQTIEPNLTSLLWFAALATVAMLALLIVAGTFPFRPPPDATRSDATPLLVAGNAVLLAALLVGTGIYGYAELRLSTLIIVAGLAVLFAPALFEIWPSFLRDGPAALGVLVGVQLLALAALARVAGFGWSNLS